MAESSQHERMQSEEVLAHVVDVHCHPTDSEILPSSMDSLPIKICAMATRESDQLLVRDLASKWPNKVIPCFGYHPWFTHWIALETPGSKEQHYRDLLLGASRSQSAESLEPLLPHLPEPILLSDVLASLRSNLTDFPNAMLGEVGLDRAFRIPLRPNMAPDSRRLSEFTVPVDHQLRILEAQLQIAVELRRNVSLHSVKAQQATLQLVDRMSKTHGHAWDMISVDLHSCGLSPEMWAIVEKNHPNIYLSLSTTINARSRSHMALIAACTSHRILAESDYHDASGLVGRTWEMVNIIAEVKGWHIETQWDQAVEEVNWGVVRRLEENWKSFCQGDHMRRRQELEDNKRNRKDRKDKYWDYEEGD